MQVHPWVNLTTFGNNRSNRTTDIGGKCAPKTGSSAFIQSVWFFLKKNKKTVFGIPFPTEKVIFTFIVQQAVSSKMVMRPKNYFSRLFWKIMLFLKDIHNFNAYKKGYIDFCRQTSPSSKNGHVLPQMIFHFFLENTAFFEKLV